LFEGLEAEPVFYFVHSYHLVAEPESREVVAATCWHGTTITAGIWKDNIYGVQFHPEKSQQNGLKLLENFVTLI
jgi:glutamine amidotransferase